MAFAGIREELASEFRGTDAQATPGFQYWEHDRSKPFLIDKKAPYILLECASLACGNEQTERFHEPTNLVRQLGGDPDQPGTCRHKRAGQHAVEPLYAYLTEKPNFC